ncbi:MAG: hypothetical protein OEL89_04900, partial [Candidatus Peregrinibacteria bacterium]|nr:hypothetical protein [Candidatus Peregrinibacteria bacterium]
DAPGRPERLYYSLEYPLGKIFFKTAPESAEDLYMASMKSLTIYSALTDTIDFPAEYEKFLIYNLAIDVAPEFNVNLQGNVIEQWGLLRNTISNRNANPIPTAKFDSALLR